MNGLALESGAMARRLRNRDRFTRLNKSKRGGLPRRQMQADRNKYGRLSALEFARCLVSFDNYLSLDSQLTSYCLDPTVAMACA